MLFFGQSLHSPQTQLGRNYFNAAIFLQISISKRINLMGEREGGWEQERNV